MASNCSVILPAELRRGGVEAHNIGYPRTRRAPYKVYTYTIAYQLASQSGTEEQDRPNAKVSKRDGGKRAEQTYAAEDVPQGSQARLYRSIASTPAVPRMKLLIRPGSMRPRIFHQLGRVYHRISGIDPKDLVTKRRALRAARMLGVEAAICAATRRGRRGIAEPGIAKRARAVSSAFPAPDMMPRSGRGWRDMLGYLGHTLARHHSSSTLPSACSTSPGSKASPDGSECWASLD